MHMDTCRVNRIKSLFRSAVCVGVLSLVFTVNSHADDTTPINTRTALPDQFTGTLRYSIPIEVPSGRNGLSPELSMTYRSTNGNGWLGMGWEMEAGAIEQVKNGPPNTSFAFRRTGAVLDLTNVSGTNEYRPLIEGEFNRIQKLTAGDGKIYWVVTNKAGVTFRFGYTTASRQDDPANPATINKWCLDRVQDTNGNFMTYTYFKDQGQIYLDRIDYTGNGATGPTKYVKFYRDSTRTDAQAMYTIGFGVKTASRVKTIDVFANAKRVRAYKLSYDYSAVTGRSILTTVTEFGSDAQLDASNTVASGTSLPPITLAYQSTEPAGGLFQGHTWNAGWVPVTPVRSNCITGDFDGDGKTDLACKSDSSGTNWYIALSTNSGDAWLVFSNGTPAELGNYCYAVDYYGGGKSDFACYDETTRKWQAADYSVAASWRTEYKSGLTPTGPCVSGEFIFPGQTVVACHVPSYNPPSWMTYPLGINDPTTGASDVIPTNDPAPSTPFNNLCMAGNFISPGRTNIACYTGSNGVWKMPGEVTWNGGPMPKATVSNYCAPGDFNGDGLTDVACNYEGGTGWNMFISTGSGWSPQGFTGPSVSKGYVPNLCQVADLNNDGKTDIACINSSETGWNAVFSSGSGWRPQQWTNPDGVSVTAGQDCLTSDFNGDGKTDMACYTGRVGNGFWNVFLANPFPTDLLSAVSNGLGSRTDIHYTPSTSYTNTSLPFAVQTVSSVTICDNYNSAASTCAGNSSVTNYAYAGGSYYVYVNYMSGTERDFRGFNYVKVTGPAGPDDEQKITETWFHQGNDTDVDANTLGGMVSVGYTKGKPYRIRVSGVTNGQTLTYMETETTYATSLGGGEPYFFYYPSRVDTYTCAGGVSGACKGSGGERHTQTVYTYDAYGNVTREEQYGDVDDSTDDRTITRSFAYNTTAWIMGLPASETVYKGMSKAAATTYYYDGVSDCSAASANQTPVKGNLTRVVRWNDTGSSSETWLGYDGYGNPYCARDANGNTSRILSYDSTYTFPKISANPLNQQTSIQYYGVDGVAADNGLYGQVKIITDLNGAQTTRKYDLFGRQIRETRADGSWTSLSYNSFGTVGAQNIRSDSSAGLWTENYFDGLGRTFRERKSGPAAKTIVTDTQYDGRGAVTHISTPYFEGVETTPVYTAFLYDGIGRTTEATNPDNSRVLNCFDEGVTVTIDPNDHRKRQSVDVYGRLAKVEEYKGAYITCSAETGTPYATTVYRYDVMSNLTNVTDTKNNQTSISYDTLGRKTAMTDPDLGWWRYAYDGNGNLLLQTDAANQQVLFGYDALNRLKSKNYGADATTEITFSYDEPASSYPVGHFTSMTDLSGTTRYHYDLLGRTNKTVKTVDGTAYIVQAAYDDLDRIKTITYPVDNETVTYNYDTGGNLSTVAGASTYAAYSGYTALGQPGSVTFGNGVTTYYSYVPLNNRLSTLATAKTGLANLVALSFFYDVKGNVTGISDSVNSPQRSGIGQTYSQYPGKAHAYGVTGRNFSFDYKGNMTADGARSISYTYDNMPQSINGAVSFVYDGMGTRVKKVASGYTVTYIDGLYECTSGGGCGKYIFAGDDRIALKNASGTFYYHPDHLGSTAVVTNASGSRVEGDFYSPFGETSANPISPFTGVKHKFTSQELDAESGLYNYNARLYNPEAGRFVSADSIVPDPSNPQSLNRYSYVLNNPVNMIDPTGYDPVMKGTMVISLDGQDYGYGYSVDAFSLAEQQYARSHSGGPPRTISGGGGDSKVNVANFFSSSSNSFGQNVQNNPVNWIDPDGQQQRSPYCEITAPSSLSRRAWNYMYSDFYNFTNKTNPNSRVDIFMKYENIALELGTGGGITVDVFRVAKSSRQVTRILKSIDNEWFRYEKTGRWITDGVDKIGRHVHFDPIPGSRGLMKWHLPDQSKYWWYNFKGLIKSRWRNLISK